MVFFPKIRKHFHRGRRFRLRAQSSGKPSARVFRRRQNLPLSPPDTHTADVFLLDFFFFSRNISKHLTVTRVEILENDLSSDHTAVSLTGLGTTNCGPTLSTGPINNVWPDNDRQSRRTRKYGWSRDLSPLPVVS